MSTSMVLLCHNLKLINNLNPPKTSSSRSLSSPSYPFTSFLHFRCKRKRLSGFVVNAAANNDNNNNYSKRRRRKKSWWQKFFFDDDGNWLGLRDDDMVELEAESPEFSESEFSSEGEKFEAWKRRAEAIVELREAQEDMRNEESRRWEDWIAEGDDGKFENGGSRDWDDEGIGSFSEEENENGLVRTFRDLVAQKEDEDILYEDRVFRFASFNSAKFVAVLILIPWALDFVVHDYVLMPFLDRYVKTVPLAAEIFDVRRSQKLEMVKELKIEKARFRLEEEIGKSPPLSDEELWWELRHKALELRDDYRIENRKAFANIWSDMVFGISLFLILYLNQSKVALLKFTGYKILSNISDTGKAFLIILITDIFLGYHSESGWQTLLEIIVEHYGFQVDSSAITIFVCFIPVILDACVKLWLFKFLPRLSPRVSNIFQEMKRH